MNESELAAKRLQPYTGRNANELLHSNRTTLLNWLADVCEDLTTIPRRRRMGSTTPEGKVKKMVDKFLLERCGRSVYVFKPVQTGYGKRGLDMHCMYKGRAFFVETKAPGKKLTALQKNTKAEIEEAGGVVFVVSLEKHLESLGAWLSKVDADDIFATTNMCYQIQKTYPAASITPVEHPPRLFVRVSDSLFIVNFEASEEKLGRRLAWVTPSTSDETILTWLHKAVTQSKLGL